MYIETWFRVYCPACQSVNWLNNGNMSNCTTSDVEGLECWNCHKKFCLDDEYESDSFKSVYGEVDFELGKKKPT